MNNALPLWLALTTVVTAVVAAFAIGFVFGEEHGARRARIKAFNQCLDWAALAMKGHSSWRYLSADRALTKAGCIIGGDDVLPPVPHPPVPHPPVLSKGSQA